MLGPEYTRAGKAERPSPIPSGRLRRFGDFPEVRPCRARSRAWPLRRWWPAAAPRGRPAAAATGSRARRRRWASPPVRAEHRLDNGVRVVIEENHVAPLVAIQVWVASGAADDPPALAGGAHFYEHLVLRGGKRRGPGGGAREIEARQGDPGGLDRPRRDRLSRRGRGAVPRAGPGCAGRRDREPEPRSRRGRAGAEAGARRARGAPRPIRGCARTRRSSRRRSRATVTGSRCWERPRRSRP